jgi:hypothetical protein
MQPGSNHARSGNYTRPLFPQTARELMSAGQLVLNVLFLGEGGEDAFGPGMKSR